MKFSPALSVSRAGPATRPDLIAVEELQQWSSANSFAQAAAGFYGNADLASWPAPLTTVRFKRARAPSYAASSSTS